MKFIGKAFLAVLLLFSISMSASWKGECHSLTKNGKTFSVMIRYYPNNDFNNHDTLREILHAESFKGIDLDYALLGTKFNNNSLSSAEFLHRIHKPNFFPEWLRDMGKTLQDFDNGQQLNMPEIVNDQIINTPICHYHELYITDNENEYSLGIMKFRETVKQLSQTHLSFTYTITSYVDGNPVVADQAWYKRIYAYIAGATSSQPVLELDQQKTQANLKRLYKEIAADYEQQRKTLMDIFFKITCLNEERWQKYLKKMRPIYQKMRQQEAKKYKQFPTTSRYIKFAHEILKEHGINPKTVKIIDCSTGHSMSAGLGGIWINKTKTDYESDASIKASLSHEAQHIKFDDDLVCLCMDDLLETSEYKNSFTQLWNHYTEKRADIFAFMKHIHYSPYYVGVQGSYPECHTHQSHPQIRANLLDLKRKILACHVYKQPTTSQANPRSSFQSRLQAAVEWAKKEKVLIGLTATAAAFGVLNYLGYK